MSIAASYAVTTQAQTQIAMQTAMVKQAHEADQSIANVLEQAVEAGQQLASAPPPGMGASVDVSA
ncbi:hypothetical protein GGD81_003420 [Rhodobium orientis]|uniref:Motility protein n=1 Tax=Rhodobium orientis TaxID=34017 RepID=A0A327JTQ9_9HYPH|nr:putative motility protein [Rhodobium orientis]MBB4304362.1 hypothetical protein [Rhodobium orientis]MBK5948144.1 hypothetical protein [Rhodobium orientis]RAI28854.1 hypothetical protein CH339_05530 [Rhodobium orientis]